MLRDILKKLRHANSTHENNTVNNVFIVYSESNELPNFRLKMAL